MMRRLLVATAVLALLGSPVFASKGGGSRSHSSGGSRARSSSGGHSGSRSKSSGSSVHVRSSTKKDGTHVEAHTRSAPHTSTKSNGKSSSSHPRPTSTTSSTSEKSTSRKSQEVAVGRTAAGKIARSEEAKRNFMRQTGYPNGRPGYVIDHIRPLACGGLDASSNMQWQTAAEAKAKDKTERIGCH